jgi:farnesyl-diphosphate farnesyltransferase
LCFSWACLLCFIYGLLAVKIVNLVQGGTQIMPNPEPRKESMSPEEIFAILPAVSRTFALSIEALLPRRARQALKKGQTSAKAFEHTDAALARDIALAYLLCRLLDTIEDDVSLPAAKRAKLLRALGRALADNEHTDAALRALAQIAPAIHATPAEKELLDRAPALFYELGIYPGYTQRAQCASAPGSGTQGASSISRHASEMAYGMADCVTDDSRGQIESRADLDRYCHYVAGTVGAMLTDLFTAHGARGKRNFPRKREEKMRAHMEAFARGLQLVNILKDCRKDFAAGRCFIPSEVIRASGLNHAQFFSEVYTDKRQAALLPLLDAASEDLDRAVIYTRAIPRRMRRARLFCILPIALARATLKLLYTPPATSDPARPRISRRQVALIALFARPAAISNLCLLSLCGRK